MRKPARVQRKTAIARGISAEAVSLSQSTHFPSAYEGDENVRADESGDDAGFGLAGECDDAPHSIGDEDEHGRCQGGVAMNHS